MASAGNLETFCKELSEEARALSFGTSVTEVDGSVSAIRFLREFVSTNRPVVFRGAVKHWKAITKWNDQHLRDKLGSKPVTVAITPNGYADAILGDRFVMPHEETMSLARLLDVLADPERHSGVHYMQTQNSNLTTNLPELADDVEEPEWAREAFGKKPDAVNIWIGDERAITSCHKDPYENIYCVVRGHKDLILHPPTDLPWLSYRSFAPAVYKRDERGTFNVEDVADADAVPWITVDPLSPDLETHPEYANATPMRVRLEAGDCLYLPSLWFHHLRQSQACIAVNFWYDMEFDCKYAYFNLLSRIAEAIKKP